ncbi:helix-turn-helix domain-containing protein [Rhizobium straminoryzae]|uniref:Helix-turn-helix domain-containing protein n=1 Tax=Rhizobium straminoryzae TaxID=1387186 RepID=A0A549TA06_9HYPH|nr:helix-turn-helix domain-containing protein [Rhizobium straminoryzae]TRL38693.1 helix-turn-helix domain-containing protein [Rhizobium straminoryzae]
MTTDTIEHQVIRSHELSRDENFEYWRAGVSSLFEARPSKDELENFRADLVSYNLGYFLIGKSSTTAQSFRRTRELVAATGVDHLLIQLYVGGECAYDADGGVAKGVRGDIVCFDLSRPMQSQTSDMDIISLVLPRSLLRLTPRVIDEMHGSRVMGDSTLGILLGEHMMSMAKVAPRLAGAEGRLAAEVASVLVSSSFSAAVAAERETLMDINLQTIQLFIERNVTNPALSPEMIMRHFALSRSALYRLFEPVGGIANYIRERRLKLAYLKLTSVGTARGSVAKLAYSTGFPSENAFSRAFQQHYGIRPSDAIRNAEAGIRLKTDLESDSDNWMQHWLEGLRRTT